MNDIWQEKAAHKRCFKIKFSLQIVAKDCEPIGSVNLIEYKAVTMPGFAY